MTSVTVPAIARIGLTRINYRARRSVRVIYQRLRPEDRHQLRKHFVFLHVPKAGGTSIRHFFRRIFFERAIYPEDSLGNFPGWEQVAQSTPTAYLGHLGWDFAAQAQAETAMVLRDPVKRLLSVYSYACRSGLRQPLIGAAGSDMSLVQFLQSIDAGIVQNVQDAQTWQLAACYHWETRERMADVPKNHIFDTARAHLKQIDWLGVSESLDDFCGHLSWQLLGRRLAPTRRNVSRQSICYADLSARERALVHRHIEMDVAIVDEARKILVERWQQTDSASG